AVPRRLRFGGGIGLGLLRALLDGFGHVGPTPGSREVLRGRRAIDRWVRWGVKERRPASIAFGSRGRRHRVDRITRWWQWTCAFRLRSIAGDPGLSRISPT